MYINMKTCVVVAVILWLSFMFLDEEEIKGVVNEELYNALVEVSPNASKECLELALSTMQGKWYITDAVTASCSRDAIYKLAMGE